MKIFDRAYLSKNQLLLLKRLLRPTKELVYQLQGFPVHNYLVCMMIKIDSKKRLVFLKPTNSMDLQRKSVHHLAQYENLKFQSGNARGFE